MKRISLLLCAAAAAILAGCGLFPIVRGSGFAVTSSFDLGSFSRVAAGQNCKVLIIADAATSVAVTCDDNLVPYLVVSKTGSDSIQIGLKQGYIYLDTTFSAEVHVPSLSGVDMSGASQAIVRPGFGPLDALSVTLSGASTADLQQVAAATLTADISGASTLSAAGTADGIAVTLSGASTAKLLDFPGNSARADLSGASECWLTVGGGPVYLTASGASTLYYRGSPVLKLVDLSGTSRIVQVP
jgi:hypothetical protein